MMSIFIPASPETSGMGEGGYEFENSTIDPGLWDKDPGWYGDSSVAHQFVQHSDHRTNLPDRNIVRSGDVVSKQPDHPGTGTDPIAVNPHIPPQDVTTDGFQWQSWMDEFLQGYEQGPPEQTGKAVEQVQPGMFHHQQHNGNQNDSSQFGFVPQARDKSSQQAQYVNPQQLQNNPQQQYMQPQQWYSGPHPQSGQPQQLQNSLQSQYAHPQHLQNNSVTPYFHDNVFGHTTGFEQHDRQVTWDQAVSNQLDNPRLPTFSPSPSCTSIAPLRSKVRSKAAPLSGQNPECIDCGKRFRTSNSPGRCGRCGIKYERRIAEPRTYTLDPSVPDLVAAKGLIFPALQGRYIPDDDAPHNPLAVEDVYVQQFLDAVNVVQTQDGADQFAARQQRTFNEKAKLEAGYCNEQVTARLRALYWETVMFHAGGPTAVYAVGGDNGGYSENRTLKFTERIAVILDVLTLNKRIVMDVVEGRGVQGFVCNPFKYHERKASNNYCNIKKKDLMDKGKDLEEGEGSAAAEGGGGGGGKKRMRATTTVTNETPLMDEAVPSIEVGEAGPSNKRSRRSARPTTGNTETAGEMDNEALDVTEAAGGGGEGWTYGSGRQRTMNWVRGQRR